MNDPRGILFDLDGTLVDTAPDLARALNQTLRAHGRAPMPFEVIRPQVSHGGIALIRLGFGIEPGHPDFEALRQQFLDHYRADLSRASRLFPGFDEVLATLEQHGLPWGIVTNKPSWLTDPLLDALDLRRRAASVVSSDTTRERKPHPLPMWHACKELGTPPEATLYIGDAERDIEAARNAGMPSLVARWGYLGSDDRPEHWGADGLIEKPAQLLDWLPLTAKP